MFHLFQNQFGLKKHKTWIIYLSLVVLTVAFAFYEYQKAQTEEKTKTKQGRIFPDLELSAVRGFSLSDEKENKTIVVSRKAGEWKLEQPVADTANQNTVSDWLKSLLEEQVQLIKKEEVDWAEYGLDKNTKKVEINQTGFEKGAASGQFSSQKANVKHAFSNKISISTKDDKKWSFRISHYSAFDGSFYIKRENTLLLGSTTWASLSNKTGEDFRSYNIVNETSHPSFIKYRSKNFSAHFKWEGGDWQWTEKTTSPKPDIDSDNPQTTSPQLETDSDAPQTTTSTDNSRQPTDNSRKPTDNSRKPTDKSLFPLSSSELESHWADFKNIQLEKDTYPNTKKWRQKLKLNRPEVEFEIGFPDKPVLQVKISPESRKPSRKPTDNSRKPTDNSRKPTGNSREPADKGREPTSNSRQPTDNSHKPTSQFYVHLSNRDYIFGLSKANRDKILLTEQKIRDHHYPFQFEKDKVAFMDITGYDLNVHLQKKQGQWSRITKEIQKKPGPDSSDEKKKDKTSVDSQNKNQKPSKKSATKELAEENQQPNQESVKKVLDQISRLSAEEYFDKTQAFEKKAHIVLKNKDKKELLHLQFNWLPEEIQTKGPSEKKQKNKPIKDKEKKKVLVKSNKGHEIMSLPLKSVQALFPPSFKGIK